MAGRMRREIVVCSILSFWAIALGVPPLRAQSIGKTFDEVVKLAAKEGKIRMASGLQRDEDSLVLKGFSQKYPAIKIEAARMAGSASRERIFSEALGGVVEYDLVDVSSEVQSKFVKAGVVAGPFPTCRSAT